MNATSLLQHDERRSGGRYHVSRTAAEEPYNAAFQNEPSTNGYSLTTPKMWPKESNYTKSQNRKDYYDSETREFSSTHTFGSSPHSSTLKHNLLESINSSKALGNSIGNNSGKMLYKNNNSHFDYDNDNDDNSKNSNTSNNNLSALQLSLIESGKLKILVPNNVKKEKIKFSNKEIDDYSNNELRHYCYRDKEHYSNIEKLEQCAIKEAFEKQKKFLINHGNLLNKNSKTKNGNNIHNKNHKSVGNDGNDDNNESAKSYDSNDSYFDFNYHENDFNPNKINNNSNNGNNIKGITKRKKKKNDDEESEQVEYQKGDWNYLSKNEVKAYSPQKHIFKSSGVDVRHEFTLDSDLVKKKKGYLSTLPDYGKSFFEEMYSGKSQSDLYYSINDGKYDDKMKDHNYRNKNDHKNENKNDHNHSTDYNHGNNNYANHHNSMYSNYDDNNSNANFTKKTFNYSLSDDFKVHPKKITSNNERNKNNKTYSEGLLEHLKINTIENGNISKNPFRPKKIEEITFLPRKSQIGFATKTFQVENMDNYEYSANNNYDYSKIGSNNTNKNNKNNKNSKNNGGSDKMKEVYSDKYDKNDNYYENIRNESTLAKFKSNTMYRKTRTDMNRLRTYSLSITADDAKTNSFQKTKIPSKKEILDSLAYVYKNNFVAYQMRITETGVLMKALKDVRHKTPGVAAIIEMHRAFVSATSVNPHNWLLNREQMISVLRIVLPWYTTESANRLFSSYDPKKKGFIRYVRVSCSALLCAEPAMNSLIEIQSKANILKNDGKNLIGQNILEQHAPEVFVLKVLFNFYEECEGNIQKDVFCTEVTDELQRAKIPMSQRYLHDIIEGPHIGVGMHLEDVLEAFCHGVCSAEEDYKMKTIAGDLVKVLYYDGQPKEKNSQKNFINDSEYHMDKKEEKENNHISYSDMPDIDFSSSIKYFPRVTKESFFRCLVQVPHVLNEFMLQLKKFRIVSAPSLK